METARVFRLGFVDEPLEGHESYQGYVTIPYLRPAGPVAMKLRRIDGEEPKYLNFPGFGTHLYNADALRVSGQTVHLCEGEFDAIILDSQCGLPAVAIPGASQWKGHPEWWELFEGRRVLFFADVDRKKEGQDPGAALAKEVAQTLDSVRVVRLPEPEGDEAKMDVSLCFLQYGADGIRKRAGLV